jgi:hypothetical protein
MVGGDGGYRAAMSRSPQLGLIKKRSSLNIRIVTSLSRALRLVGLTLEAVVVASIQASPYSKSANCGGSNTPCRRSRSGDPFV